MQFLQVSVLASGFLLRKNGFPPSRNAREIMFIDYDVMVLSQTPLMTITPDVINRAKFDVGTPSAFGEVKVHARKDRIALYDML